MAKGSSTKNKKFNMTNIGRVTEKAFPKRKHLIDIEGETFEVTIDEVFKNSKIEAMMLDMAKDLEACEENGIEMNFIVLGNLHIIQAFTDVQFSNDIVKKINTFIDMTDMGATEKILNKFDKKELDKIDQYIKKMREGLPIAMEELYREMSEANKIQSDIDGKIEQSINKEGNEAKQEDN